MRKFVSLLGSAALLIGCSDSSPLESPVDCGVVLDQIDSCMEAEDADLSSCIPHSRQAKISGVWAYDFEHNVFFETEGMPNEKAELSEFKKFRSEFPELAIRDATFWESVPDRAAMIVDITFLGRHPLCKPVQSRPWIQVDEVLGFRVLQQGEEGAITYSPANQVD